MSLRTVITARRARLARAALAAIALVVPVAAHAQRSGDPAGTWRVGPTLGMWRFDDRGQFTRHQTGQFVGVEASRQQGARFRLTASAGYYRLDGSLEVVSLRASGEERIDVYDAQLVPVSAGAAYDVWQSSAAAVSVGLEAGAAWSRDDLARSSGSLAIAPMRDDWTPVFLAAPALSVRRAVGSRLELTASGRVLLGFGDLDPSSIPTLALGAAFRI